MMDNDAAQTAQPSKEQARDNACFCGRRAACAGPSHHRKCLIPPQHFLLIEHSAPKPRRSCWRQSSLIGTYYETRGTQRCGACKCIISSPFCMLIDTSKLE